MGRFLVSKKDTAELKAEMAQKGKHRIWYMIAIAFLAIVTFWVAKTFCFSHDYKQQFEQKVVLLEEKVFSDSDLEGEINKSWADGENAKYVVFFSVCDTHNRATVINGTGPTLREAWDNAAGETKKFIIKGNYNPVWVKADIVNATEKIDSTDIGKKTKNLYDNFLRQGIAFDDSFSTALLEAEINGNKIINYDKNKIDLQILNKYLKEYNRPGLAKIPDDLILFSCQGYFCDDTNTVYELYANDLDYGRRKVDVVDKAVVKDLIYTSSQFLANSVREDGKFIYGYYPTYDKELQDYNILRHTGTIWSLIAQYKTTGDETLVPKIESTMSYLINGAIEYPQDDIAYVIERKSDEVKLGGNAVAIITLIDYMNEFGTDKYRDLAVQLGNGILELQDPQTGKYYHVLNYEDYSKKEETRTVYYDGEATFALAKLYGYVKDEKFLQAAQKAADYFIANDYTVHRDHWVAYSMNEITKYVPEERYFEFALKNAQDNLDKIYNQKTSYHTYLELLMATFETFDRIKANNIQVAYLQEFNQQKFIETIYHRARHQLNGYLYPEYAMYLKNPARIVNTFCVRHDGYRVRIDDVQHFIGGYYSYYKYYDRLEEYRNSNN